MAKRKKIEKLGKITKDEKGREILQILHENGHKSSWYVDVIRDSNHRVSVGTCVYDLIKKVDELTSAINKLNEETNPRQ